MFSSLCGLAFFLDRCWVCFFLVVVVIVTVTGFDDDDEFRVDALCVDTPEGLKRATTYSVLLQNAETVRLVGDAETGDAVSVSAMRVGDGVLVHRLAGGRHTGIEIAEEGWEER